MATIVAETQRVAQQLGISAKDLLTAISYETAGTFDPAKAGPTTKWGQHRGLIQMGEPQAAKYGVTDFNNIQQQFDGILAYLKDAGVRSGDDLHRIYAAINTGTVKGGNRSDAANGGAWGTANDKVDYQMSGHIAKSDALLARYGTGAGSSSALEMLNQAEATAKATAALEAMEGPLKEANLSLQQQEAMTRAQAASLGLSTAEVTRMSEAQRLLNEYTRAGVPITDELRAGINAYAQRAGEAAQAAENLARSQEMVSQFSGMTKEALGGFISDLRQGKSAGDAFANMLEHVADRMLDMALNAMFDTKGGGIGGLLGSLLSGLGGLGGGGFMPLGPMMHDGGLVGRDASGWKNVHPAYFENAPRYHNGLRPDEVPAILQQGEWVLSKQDVAAIRSGAGNGGLAGSQGVTVNVQNIDQSSGGVQVQTQAKPNGMGGVDLVAVITDRVKGEMAREATRNGSFAKVMGAPFSGRG